jgi:uncharacterized membrane protein
MIWWVDDVGAQYHFVFAFYFHVIPIIVALLLAYFLFIPFSSYVNNVTITINNNNQQWQHQQIVDGNVVNVIMVRHE